MRTNLTLSDDLMNEALSLTGLTNKREAIELALKTLIQLKRQERIREYRGKLRWESNLDDRKKNER